MENKQIVLAFTILIFALGFFIAFNPQLTGYATLSNKTSFLIVDLTKSAYQENQTVQGNIIIKLIEPINKNSELTLLLASESKSLNLTDILSRKSLTFESTEEIYNGSAKANKKTLTFDGPGKQLLALRLPSDIESIDALTMDIKGTNIKRPSIDISDDGYKEWVYLGSRTTYKEVVLPKYLDDTSTDQIFLKKNKSEEGSLYCELFDVPYSKDFQVEVKFKSEASDGLRATILQPAGLGDSFKASGGTDVVAFSESSSLQWNSADLHLTYPIVGNILLCLFVERGDSTQKSYTLGADSSDDRGTDKTTAYTCDYDADKGDVQCDRFDSADLQIRLKPSAYSEILNTQTDLKTSESFIEAFSTSLLFASSSCTGGFCFIPLVIEANSSGTLELSNLNLEYTKGSLTSTTSDLYTFEIIPGKITKIGTIDLTKNTTTLEVPLSYYALKTPALPSNFSSYAFTLKAKLNDLTNGSTVNVFKEGALDSSSSIEAKINATEYYLTKLKASPTTLEVLGYTNAVQNALSQLTIYKSSIKQLSNLSEEQVIEQTNQKIDALLETVPREIIPISAYKDVVPIQPSDLTQELAGDLDLEELKQLQNSITVNLEVQSSIISFYTKPSIEKTVFKKTITSSKSLGTVDIIEFIPKTVASSVSQINFTTTPTAIINSDPVVKFTLSGLPQTISYSVDGDKVAPTNLVVIPSTITGGSTNEPICGDGKCTVPLEDKITCPEDCKSNIPWGWVIFLLLFVVLLAYYLNMYKGKGNFDELKAKVIKTSPFKNKSDLENLENFIKKARQRRIPDIQIKKVLESKGWKKNQIDYAFNELDKTSKIKTDKKSPKGISFLAKGWKSQPQEPPTKPLPFKR